MTRKDNCIKDMRNGMLWKELLEKYPKSTIYDCLHQYDEEAEKKYHKSQKKIEEFKNEINELDKLVKQKNENNKFLDIEEKKIVKNIAQLEEKKVNLSKEVAVLAEKLSSIRTNIIELESIGITIDVLESVLESDIVSSEDFLERVRTKREYDTLKAQLKEELNSLAKIRSEIKEESEILSKVKQEKKSEENSLDQIKSENILLKEAIDVVTATMLQGFNTRIIRNLLRSLMDLSIKDQPITSAERLLHRLESAKKEQELEYSILKMSKEKKILETELAELKVTIKALEQSVLKHIRETQDKATRAIEKTSQVGVNAVKETQKQVVLILQDTRDTILQTIGSLEKLGKNKLNEHQTELLGILNFTSLKLQRSLEFYESQIKQWGKDKQEAGRYQTLIQQATLLFGVIQNQQAILNLDPKIVLLVTERLHFYVSAKYPDAKTYAPKEIARGNWAISEIYESKITALTYWLKEALKKMLEGI